MTDSKIEEIIQEFRASLEELKNKQATGQMQFGVKVEVNMINGSPGRSYVEEFKFKRSIKK